MSEALTPRPGRRPLRPLLVRYGLATLAALFVLGIAGLITAAYVVRPPAPDLSVLWERRGEPSIKFLDLQGNLVMTRGAREAPIVPLAEMPPHLWEAFLAIEDRRFYEHGAVDYRGLLRATIANLFAGRLVQGGSTITQQLAKNLFLTPERSVLRKVQEIWIAYWLEKKLSKDAILTLYLNRVYLGSGNYGVEAASQFYFGKHAKDVTLAEAAMLAGLPKAPTKLAPTKNLNLAQARARLVLDGMVEAGFIKDEDAKLALGKPAAPAETEAKDAANYFVDWASDELWSIAEAHDAAGWRDKNLIVKTTYDPVLQIKAELAVMNGLGNAAETSRVSQAALVALDPSGAVRAMVGGRSYAESQFNRATQALRQPGSAFKPFVYLTALEQGMDPNTVMFDGPISVDGWSPENYEGNYEGQVTLVQALAQSINTVAVQVSEAAGRQNVIDTAHRLGITEKMDPVPSIALGTTEVTVLELAGAYLPFVNDGYPEHPYGILQVKTDQGDILYNHEPATGERVIASHYVALMTYMMGQVMEEGTGRGALLADGRPAAGKTGTSQDNRDAWFVGFTPQLLTAVWVGNDDDSPMNHVVGGGLSARMWKDFMDRAHRGAAVIALNEEAPETSPVFASAEPGASEPIPPRRRCFLFFCSRD